MDKDFNSITDEQLAQFIDGNMSEEEQEEVLELVETKEDLETLALAFSAKELIEEEESLDNMPEFDLSRKKRIDIYPFEPLPMTGFLGNETNEEEK